MGIPPADIAVGPSTVRALLRAVRPDLGDAPPVRAGEGWDAVMWRVGPELALRLPRGAASAALLLHEQRRLPVLAPRLPVAVPVPVHAGVPSDLFPWPWSLVPWIEGVTADRAPPLDGAAAAGLAEALAALHAPAPADSPVNVFRGVPLATRAEAFDERLARLRGHRAVDAARVEGVWREGLAAPVQAERRWIHGDLHARNVVVREGRVAGLLDWVDVCGGDPATDLALAWTVLSTADARAVFLETYRADPASVARAAAWAVYLGMTLVDSGDPLHVALGAGTLARVTAGPLASRP